MAHLFLFLEEDRGIGGVGNTDFVLDGDVLRLWPSSFKLYVQVRGTIEALRSIKAWVKNSQRPPAMIYAETFSLLFCCSAKASVCYEDFTKVSFEFPTLCNCGKRCQN